jgi:hypothetical protein
MKPWITLIFKDTRPKTNEKFTAETVNIQCPISNVQHLMKKNRSNTIPIILKTGKNLLFPF